MKYLKLYEEIGNIPKVGDYVLINHRGGIIGQIVVDPLGSSISYSTYRILFTEIIPFEMPESYWAMDNILFFSTDRKDCEIFIQSRKYNL